MNRSKGAMACVLLATSASGCSTFNQGTPEALARSVAHAQSSCPKAQISAETRHSGWYRTTGCGTTGDYECGNVTDDTGKSKVVCRTGPRDAQEAATRAAGRHWGCPEAQVKIVESKDASPQHVDVTVEGCGKQTIFGCHRDPAGGRNPDWHLCGAY